MGKLLRLVILLLPLAGCSIFAPEKSVRVSVPSGDPARCLAELRSLSARFEEMADFATPDGCRVVNPVKLERTRAAFNRPATMACPLAVALIRFDEGVVQPVARQILRQGVKRIHHVGAYDCRSQRDGRRLSQHGLGMALDFWAFELDDGTIIKVRDDWQNKGNRTTFLRRISEDACQYFNLVLTPGSDRDHYDHIHVDLGPWKRCG